MNLQTRKLDIGGRRHLVLAACAVLAAGGALLPAGGTAAAQQQCPTTSTGATAPTQVSAADQSTILQLHNQYRSAVNEAPLAWDDSLAADAQGWVDQMVPLGMLCHDPNPKGEGENLADYGTVAAGVQSWYGEKTAYDNDPNKVIQQSPASGTNWLAWGHYTQMVWSGTQRVGCGQAPSQQFPGNVVLSCRYSPPGNIVGQTAY